MIDLAIDDGESDEFREDWTSNLGINLRHCVKIRKNSPSEQVQHALSLGDLFSEKSPCSDFSKLTWQFRRSRSKIKLNHPAHSRPHQHIEIKIGEVMEEKKLDGNIVKKEEKLIQYSRRKFKLKPDLSTGNRGRGRPRKLLAEEVSAATSDKLDEHNRNSSKINIDNIGNSGIISAESFLSPNGMSEGLHEVQVLEATSDVSLNYSPSRVADSLATATLAVDSIEHNETKTVKELNIKGNTCNEAACASSEMQQKTNDIDVISEKIKISYAEKCSSHQIFAVDGLKKLREDQQRVGNSACLYDARPPVGSLDAEIEDVTVDNSCMNSEIYDHMTSDNKVRQDMHTTIGNNNEDPISCNDKLIDQPPASTAEVFEDMRETCAAEDSCNGVPIEDNMQHESNNRTETNEEFISSSIPLENSEFRSKECVAADLCSVGTKEETISSSVTRIEVDRPSILSVEGCPEVSRGIFVAEDVGADGMHLENQTTETNMDRLVSHSSLRLDENQPIPASIGGCSEASNRIHAVENVSVGTTDNEQQKQNQTTNVTNEEPKPNSPARRNQPTPALIRKYSRTRKESSSAEKLCNDNEVCLSKDKRQMDCNEPTVEDPSSSARKGRKRKRELEQITENKCDGSEFIRSPCEGLRPRADKNAANKSEVDVRKMAKEKLATRIMKKPSNVSVPCLDKKKTLKEGCHRCDLDGCRMSFETKRELSLHKNNRCPHEGCGKRFSSHKYAIIHQRVHDDERPLKCPWKGCSMSFKWAWARTEHIRVHTGERPYQCKFEGCGLSFRFVSDISRHRRKTGHYENLSS